MVIHSIPPEGSDKPWEEWYTLSGNPTHVWLFEQPTPQTAGHVDIGWDDFDHPLRVRGKRWYLYQAAMPKLAEKES